MPAARRNRERRERAEAELNLIPMIDIMSVMVAFLLVYSADVEVIQNSKGVEVPQSVAEELPKQSVVVMITKDQLFVQGELVANVEDIRDATTQLIAPLRAVLERPMVDGRRRRRGGGRRVARDHGARATSRCRTTWCAR